MIATLEETPGIRRSSSGAVVASLEGVSKNYGEVRALRSVNFAVRAGEVVALLGPNGAGKTTAVKLFLGLLQPNSGKTRVFGGDPTNPQNRMRTGAMLQVGKVPETLRVGEHIDLFSSYYPNPLPLEEVLAAAGLEKLRDRKFGIFPAGRDSEPCLRWRSAVILICYSWMSQPSGSMWRPAARSGKRFAASSSAGKPFCSPRITLRRPTLSPTASP